MVQHQEQNSRQRLDNGIANGSASRSKFTSEGGTTYYQMVQHHEQNSRQRLGQHNIKWFSITNKWFSITSYHEVISRQWQTGKWFSITSKWFSITIKIHVRRWDNGLANGSASRAKFTAEVGQRNSKWFSIAIKIHVRRWDHVLSNGSASWAKFTAEVGTT